MIKHSTYVLITLMVILLFFLFQMIMMNLFWADKWSVNFEKATIDTGTIKEIIYKDSSKPEYIIISSGRNISLTENVERLLTLIKKPYIKYSSCDDLPEEIPETLVTVIICDGNLDRIGDLEKLFKYTDSGIDAVFTTKFNTTAGGYIDNYKKFGINREWGSGKQKKIDFLDGIFSIGKVFEGGITTGINFVELNGTCEIFAVGTDDEVEDYTKRNPIIWRSGRMYFINATFLEEFSYAGILLGVLSMDKDAYVYPVVNTALLIVDGLPRFAKENEENIKSAYILNMVQFQREVVWSDLMGMANNINVKYTFFPKIGSEQSMMEGELLAFFGRELIVNRHELGYYPGTLINKVLPKYELTAGLHYSIPDLTGTVVFDNKAFSANGGKSAELPIISAGSKISDEDIIKAISVASGLGYVSHYLDMGEIFDAAGTDDLWKDYKLNFVQTFYRIAKQFEYLDFETATQGANKMKIFMNSKTDIKYSDNRVTIAASNLGQMSYMLKTKKEITGIINCTVNNVYGDYYYVVVNDKDAEVTLKNKS